MIGGFQRPSTGRVFFGSRDVTEQAANRRDVGFVFQNYALFPHLSVFDNVAYGLRVKRLQSAEIARGSRRACGRSALQASASG